MTNLISKINNKQLSIVCLFVVLIFSACSKKEQGEPFCKIKFEVETNKFYQGCTVPISIQAGEGTSKNTQVNLFINDVDMGLVSTTPQMFYWETKSHSAGKYSIKAVYTASNNQQTSDEKIIDLLPIDATCPSEIQDIDGNSYPIVQIGNQCWMQKNLMTTRYADGEALISGLDSLPEIGPTELPGWYFAYDRDLTNVESYGFLYTWSTAMKGNKAATEESGPIQGICPDRWHVPDMNEWNALIDFVGGVDIAASKLKDNTSLYWTNNLAETDNSSGFTALPGGDRIWAGRYMEKGSGAYFWTATETIPNHAYHIYLRGSDSKSFILGHQDSKRFGYSVRCVKD